MKLGTYVGSDRCSLLGVLTGKGLKSLQYLLKIRDQPSANLLHNYFAQGECFTTWSLLQEACAEGDLHTFQYIMAGSNFNNYFRDIAEVSTNPPKFESKGSDIHKVTLTHYFSPGQVRVILHPCEKKESLLTTI